MRAPSSSTSTARTLNSDRRRRHGRGHAADEGGRSPVHVAGRPVAIEALVAAMAAPRDRGRRGCSPRLPESDRRPTAGWPGPSGRWAPSRSTRRRRSRPARAGMLVTDDEAFGRPGTASCRSTASARDAWKRYAASGLVVLRDRGCRLQVQPDRPRRRAGPGPAGAGGRAARGASRARRLRIARRSRLRRPRTWSTCPTDAPDGSHAWHLFIIRLHLDRLRIDRAAVHRRRWASRGSGRASTSSRSTCHPYYRRLGCAAGAVPGRRLGVRACGLAAPLARDDPPGRGPGRRDPRRDPGLGDAPGRGLIAAS